MDQFTCKIKDHSLPLKYLCLLPECTSQYNCESCIQQKHKDHSIILIADLEKRIDQQNLVTQSIRQKIQDSLNDLKSEFNTLFKKLEQEIMNLLSFNQKPFNKLKQQQQLNYEDIYLFKDLFKEKYNSEQYEVIFQQIQNIKSSVIASFQEIIKPLEQGNLDLNLPDFVFTPDLVYRDIKIIDPKTIEDKIVLSMSLHLGQALVFPAIQDCNQGIVKIRFHIIKVGMSVQIGLGIDLEHSLYCTINQKGETYSLFDNAAHNRKCDFQFQSQDVIQCILDKNKQTLQVKNEKSNEIRNLYTSSYKYSLQKQPQQIDEYIFLNKFFNIFILQNENNFIKDHRAS
ncbi:hypothetical protein pb186bvf_011154 [Paramecium bursaria]